MQSSNVLAPPLSSTNVASVYPQGSSDFLRDIAASLIKKLNHYVRSNIKLSSQLKDAIPLVKHAVELYIMRDYSQSIIQSFQAYLFIEALRARTSEKLPAL